MRELRAPAAPQLFGEAVRRLRTCYQSKACPSADVAALALLLEAAICEVPHVYQPNGRLLVEHLYLVRRTIGEALFHQAQKSDWRAPTAAVNAAEMCAQYLKHALRLQADLCMDTTDASTSWQKLRYVDAVLMTAKYRRPALTLLRELVQQAESLLLEPDGRVRLSARHALLQALSYVVDAAPEAELPALPAFIDNLGLDGINETSAPMVVRAADLLFRYGERRQDDRARELGLKFAQAAYAAGSRHRPGAPMLVSAVLLSLEAAGGAAKASGHEVPGLTGLLNHFDVARHLAHGCPHDAAVVLSSSAFLARFDELVDTHDNIVVDQLRASLLEVRAGAHARSDRSSEAAADYKEAARLSHPRVIARSVDEILRGARRLTELARLEQDAEPYVRALAIIDYQATKRVVSPQPYLLLARQLEKGGLPELSVDARCPERDNEHVCAFELARNKAFLPVFALAAQRAASSTSMRRRQLGGRSGAMTPISLALTDEAASVVVKGTTRLNLGRELAALERIRPALPADGSLRVANFLGEQSAPDADADVDSQLQVIALWQWTEGDVADIQLLSEPGRASAVLPRLSGYLGLLHRALAEPTGLQVGHPEGGRRTLRKEELGRWLKGLLPPDSRSGTTWESVFDTWYSDVVALELPWTPKRDAHLGNWVLTADGAVVAVDFESTGWVPFGYELAQLTEDAPVLGIDEGSTRTRRDCLDAYAVGVLGESVAQERAAQIAAAYELGRLARLVRVITGPAAGRDTGLTRLDALAGGASTAVVREIALLVTQAWRLRGGEVPPQEPELARLYESAERRRASKRLSYLLRHADGLARDEHGWSPMAEVVRRMAGYKEFRTLDPDDIEQYVVDLVLRLEEHRFELRGHNVRARYGHSRAVRYETETSTTRLPKRLLHGTTAAGVTGIFGSESGLRPGSRAWVHLSADVEEARRVASRRGEPLLLVWSTDYGGSWPPELHPAGGTTWVTSTVSAEELRIMPLREAVSP